MDRNFSRALKLVLKHEGGWADHPKDPGGATMKGITIATYRRYVNAKGTKDDLRRISDAEVATIYRRQYWNAIKGDELPDGLDYAVFDFAVNSGPGRAAKYLQAACGVAQDGKIGPVTLASVKLLSAAKLINSICDARLAFMRKLKTWDTFGRGWNERVKQCRAEALIMCAVANSTTSSLPPAQPAQKPADHIPDAGKMAPPPRAETPPVTAPDDIHGLAGLLVYAFKALLNLIRRKRG